ncbi:MAG: cytochrome c [Rhodospirillaceae bacterium]
MNFPRMLGVVLAGIVLTGAAAAQQKAPADVIKARHEQMKALGADFKTINDALKTDAPAVAAIAAAGKHMAETIKGLNALYPAGTGPDSGVKTRALPEIWLQNAAFKSAADASEAESVKFAVTATVGNVEAIKTGFKALTDSCVACHNKFRAPEEKK